MTTGGFFYRARHAVLLAMSIAGACSVNKPSDSVLKAVLNRDEGNVRALVAARANLEERDVDASTPLLLASETNQFVIAEVLIDNGANIWATSEFGDTVGFVAERSRLAGGADFEARARVLEKLKARGFPFPAEQPAVVEEKLKRGEWPPRAVAAR
jgi:hypothetical protein